MIVLRCYLLFLLDASFYSIFQLTLLMSSSFIFLTGVVSSRLAQAPCKHVVEFAKTAVNQNPGSTVAMRELANVRVADAESGCHRVFKKYHLVPSVTFGQASLRLGAPGAKPRKFPYIKLSSWMRHLLETDQLPMQMTGVANFDTMRVVLKEFWKRHRAINPSFALFQLADSEELSLDLCIPYFSHSDEGRSYKHLGLWVLSAHGALGRGTKLFVESGQHRLPVSNNEFGLNFLGKTWSTQFIFTTMIKTVYSKFPEAQTEMVSLFAQDVAELFYQGLTTRDGLTLHFVHLGHKGDLPALVRMGEFKRSFSHVPRQASSRKSCPGICHLCMAGVEAGPDYPNTIPFEDMTPQAAWVNTRFEIVPWDNIPKILVGLPLWRAERMSFFLTDLWHNYHLGVSKHFIGSAFTAIIESSQSSLPALVGGAVEAKFNWLTTLYLSYFRAMGKNPYINEISRETMGFPMGSTCPIARWSKGQASTEFMYFLEYFCRLHILNKTTDPLLISIVSRYQS